MQVFHDPEQLHALCDERRARGDRVALVPTMGALHVGHAKLVEEARARADLCIVSVFVNPTQFGPNEDFAKYPRTLDDDVTLAKNHGADIVFAPEASRIYLEGDETRVRVGRTVEALCGEHRPTHFEGVTTVVAKFFNVVGPCLALFGRKDYQQLQAIRRMVKDLFMPIEVLGVATVREHDGLALSSRNRYLSPDDRVRARCIPEALSLAARAFDAGERDGARLTSIARAHIAPHATSIDYVTLADADSVVPIVGTADGHALLAVAVRIAGTRLIDNLVLGEDPAPIAEAS